MIVAMAGAGHGMIVAMQAETFQWITLIALALILGLMLFGAYGRRG